MGKAERKKSEMMDMTGVFVSKRWDVVLSF